MKQVTIRQSTGNPEFEALIVAAMKAGREGYDQVKIESVPAGLKLKFSVKKRCPRCGGNKHIIALVGKNKDIGTIPCPDCNHGKTITKGNRHVK